MRPHTIKNIAFLSLALSLPLPALAWQNGLALSYGTDPGTLAQPTGLNGGGLTYILQPDSWKWGQLNLSMNLSYGFWKTTDFSEHQSISIYALAPTLRWSFLQNATATPFLEGSIGGAILSSEYIADRNLGSSVLFQYMGGFGVAFGPQQKLFASLEVAHYSNAGLCENNSGMTIPLLFSIGGVF